MLLWGSAFLRAEKSDPSLHFRTAETFKRPARTRRTLQVRPVFSVDEADCLDVFRQWSGIVKQTSPKPIFVHRPPSGFTLLELLLVLALIVLIGAIVAPKLDEVFERQKLKASANELRLQWDRARLEAMRTGQAQVFQCQVGTGEYNIKPLVLQSDTADAGAGATVMTGAGNLVETQASGFFTAANLAEDEQETLEEKITFVSCRVASDMRAYAIAQEAQSTGSSASNDVTTQTIAHQVVFYPDGSASTAEVQIKNERGDVQGVRMRGLTGHCRILSISTMASAENDRGVQP